MIGVYYYPEQWPEHQWERDIENIRKMGMTHIHMAEFSWTHLEPRQGEFHFAWLDRAVDLAVKNGLGIILCTPTATPPAWMSDQYPEILMVKDNGRRVTHGSRAHRCVNAPRFNDFASAITRKLGRHFGSNPNIIGWQVDNEIGHYDSAPCYCDACLDAFQEYLREKYQTIENLNTAWAGDFWSQNLDDFSQVKLPNPQTLPYSPNEHALLDFRTFFSRSLSRFLERQSRLLKPFLHSDAWITHNFMKDDPVHYPGHVRKGLDLFSLTLYPVAGQYTETPGRELHRIGDPINLAANLDQIRSHNGRWGLMELQPGQVNWGPCNLRPWPGSTRLWLWTAIAHGADILSTYRYRQPLSGAEQFHEGMVGLDGLTLTQGGKDFSTVARELDRFKEDLELEGPVTSRRAAIYLDWKSLTALSIHPQSDTFNPWQCWLHYYGALKQLGMSVDVLHAAKSHDLSPYDVVCTGLYDLADASLLEDWKGYVNTGGNLVVTLRTATRNPDGHFPEQPYGQRISDLTGAPISGYDLMPEGHRGKIELLPSKRTIQWQTWAEQYSPPEHSRILAVFSDQFYQGASAAFSTERGKGTVIGIGFDHRQGIKDLVYAHLSTTLPDIEALPDQTVFCIKGRLGIFLNFNDRPMVIPDPILKNGQICLGQNPAPACGVTLIRY